MSICRGHLFGIGLVLIATLALRLHGLTLNSLWIDEFYSLEISAGHGMADYRLPRDRIIDPSPHLTRMDQAEGWGHIWSRLDDDMQPPLYYMILRPWRECFGSGDGTLRLLSVILSLVTVGLLFELGRYLIGATGAIWACAIYAVARPQIWYAQETRGYVLLTAVFLGAAIAVIRIEQLGFNRRRGVALSLCLLGSVLTHYFAAPACLALGVYAVIRLRGRDRVRTIMAMFLAGVVFFVIWGPFFLRQLHGISVAHVWMDDLAEGFYWRFVGRVFLSPFVLLCDPATNAQVICRVAGGVLIVLPMILLRRQRRLLLPVMCMIVWVGTTAAVDLWRHALLLNHERFYLAAGPFLYIVIAGMQLPRYRWVSSFISAAVVLYCVLSFPWVYISYRAEWRSFGRIVAEHVRDGDVIVYYTPHLGQENAGTNFLCVDHYAANVHPRSIFLTRPVEGENLAALREARGVWLVTDVPDFDVPAFVPGFVQGDTYSAYQVGLLMHLRRE